MSSVVGSVLKVISPNFRAERDLNEHGVASKERNVQVVALAAQGEGSIRHFRYVTAEIIVGRQRNLLKTSTIKGRLCDYRNINGFLTPDLDFLFAFTLLLCQVFYFVS